MKQLPPKLAALPVVLGFISHKRDTAEACREKATSNLALAINMPNGNERLVLERSAAAWSMRAEQLDHANL